MTEKRIPRESQTRKKEARRTPWKPPSMLEASNPRRDLSIVGFELGLSEDDKTNVHAKLREGWEPVRADEYPDFESPTIEEGKFQGVIGNGAYALSYSEETVSERTAYFRDQTRNQMKAVDENLMREQHPSMPIQSDRQSRVTFGGNRKDVSD